MRFDPHPAPVARHSWAPFDLAGRQVFPLRNEVVVGGRARRLEPRHMKVLQRLARGAGDPVTRDDLMDAGWGAQIVGDDSLTQAISKLRRALDDGDGGVLIQTLPKTGYRLTCAPTPIPERSLDVTSRGSALPFFARAAASWIRAHVRVTALSAAVLVCASAFAWRASELIFAPEPAATAQAPSDSPAPERRIILLKSFGGPAEAPPPNLPRPVDL